METITLKRLISHIKSDISPFYPAGEVEAMVFIILQHSLKLSRTAVYLNQDSNVPKSVVQSIEVITKRLKNFEPLQYILGETEFYNCTLKVGPGVLIPRPETEELVDWLLKDNPDNKKLDVIDFCTGSGCIAIAIGKERPSWNIQALDISPEALVIAKENALFNAVKIKFIQEDILNNKNYFANQNFDLMVSNPPYITEEQRKEMLPNVLQWEPHLALFAKGPDPLVFYRKIADLAISGLRSGGQVFLELNEALAQETADIFKNLGFETELHRDIHEKFRMLKAIKHTH